MSLSLTLPNLRSLKVNLVDNLSDMQPLQNDIIYLYQKYNSIKMEIYPQFAKFLIIF